MSYGFLALNNSNQVLVSSDTRNLHFIGKIGLFSSAIKCYRYVGSVVFLYHVYSPVPIVPFFTMPTTDYYCITAVRNLGDNIWEIELLRSGLQYEAAIVNEPTSGYSLTGDRYVTITSYGASLATADGSALVWDGVGYTLTSGVPPNTFTVGDGATYTWTSDTFSGWDTVYVPSPGYGQSGSYYYVARFPVKRSRTVYNPIPGTAPEMYVFADPRAASSTETHGMIVYRDDGTPSFDSRLRPLAITGGYTVVPPSNPRTAAIPSMDAKNCNTSNSDAFTPDNYTAYGYAKTATKEIVSFSSLAQTQKQVDFNTSEEECDGAFVYGNCVGAYRRYEWWSRYWCFYRAGIARAANGNIHCGWIPVEFGCNWDYKKDSAFIGIGTGGDSGNGGIWPYSNETLNLVQTAVITADGARYD